MLRARIAVGLCLATVVAAVLVIVLGDGDDPRAARGDDCSDPESTYTSDSLHDVRSFADAMAIVTGVKEDAANGGRTVTMRVERVLWRRPHAPRPPETARFGDLNLAGCGETRMELGRRYLAPIVRQNGAWYPFFRVRLLLDGDRVVGGVDEGEPNNSHQALAGRTVRDAVRTVARTNPYRAVVRDPSGNPAHRWQRVDRDGYRVWRQGRGAAQIVDSGVTSRARWQLYMRVGRRGGVCVGMTARALWQARPQPSGETCGPRGVPRTSVTLGLFGADGLGEYAFGRAGPRVWALRVRFEGGRWRRVEVVPPQIARGVRGGLWVAPARGDCALATVQALGRGDRVLDVKRVPRPPGVDPGEPDPYASC
jgi:hypothetical protein